MSRLYRHVPVDWPGNIRQHRPVLIEGHDDNALEALREAQKLADSDPDLILGNLAEAGWALVPITGQKGERSDVG